MENQLHSVISKLEEVIESTRLNVDEVDKLAEAISELKEMKRINYISIPIQGDFKSVHVKER